MPTIFCLVFLDPEFPWLILYVVFVKISPLPFDDQSEEKLSKHGGFREIPETLESPPSAPPSNDKINRKA